jgi:hypothetical protein
MSRKLAILFAVLAIVTVAYGTVGSGSPSSSYSVAVGNIFTNATDTTFTNIQKNCYWTAGFDNTTNYIWCQAGSRVGTAAGTDALVASTFPGTWSAGSVTYYPLILQRRTINASSPATKNATLDLKITTSLMANDGGVFCGGVGYLGVAYGYGSGTTATTVQSDVSFSYIAVNGTTVTTVKLTSADATLRSKAKYCMYDHGIFYIIYTQDANAQTVSGALDYSKNKYMIQGVNVTSGAVFYNSTGGVAVLTQVAGLIGIYDGFTLIPTNWTGYGSTLGLLTYFDSTTVAASGAIGTGLVTTTGSYKVVPITLATGAPGSVVALGTTTASSLSTEVTVAAVVTTSSVTVWTTYGVAGGFGSLSTYGVVVTKQVDSKLTTVSAGTTVGPVTTSTYSSSIFLNGSSTASTSFNLTNPTGYNLQAVSGYSTATGFGLLSVYGPNNAAGTAAAGTPTGTTNQINKDTYFANGTAILSAVSLGTFDNYIATTSPTPVTLWIDAAGSPWLGYITYDSAVAFTGLGLVAGYAGEIATNILSGTVLTNIFATLAFTIAALFAF